MTTGNRWRNLPCLSVGKSSNARLADFSMLNPLFLLLPFVLQTLCMAVDELHFHRQRGLPRWERLGHPLDTLTVVACYAWLFFTPPSTLSITVYAGLSVFSSLFITKDEWVHNRYCGPAECWLHTLLFILHPLYHQLGERWYTAQDDPVALLRAESRTRNPWVADLIRQHFTANDTPILDIGCGGGFLSNHLAQAGFRVMGLDASAGSLRIAQQYDATSSACRRRASPPIRRGRRCYRK